MMPAEIVDRLVPLDLGDDAGLAAGRAQQRARLLDVGRIAREGHGDVVDALLGRELDVLAVAARRCAGAEMPPPWRLSPLRSESSPPTRTRVSIVVPPTRSTSSTIWPSLSSSVSPAPTSRGRSL